MQEPKQIRKIFTLNEYVGEAGDIADPYGADLDTYRETYKIIDNRILRLIEKLKDSNPTLKDES
jgi:protein-tyrosine phosphatase